ncbi:MAG: hypothetical protein Q8P57_05075, partial [Candidatus Pacearchaeota archaeon]|nr:hypothetical protein [Candidatus Pacearchaeota archaeon]
GPDGTGDTFFSGSFEELNLESQYLQYIFYFESEDSELNPYLNNIEIDYDILAVNPIVEIAFPGEEQTFGTNESLELNFSVQSDDLDSCWYTLDEGLNNASIVNCENMTFDVSGNGDYTLEVYANESVLGLEGYDEVNFSVLIGAPSILLHSPINSYLGYTQNIGFNYTATDIDLDSCSLFGNFSGEFILNETHSDVVSGVQDTFFLNLTEGTYLWNVYCNDTLGNGAFDGNKTFSVDVTNPAVSISAPLGTYNNLAGIPLDFSVTDASPVNCVYNVSFASSGEQVVKNKVVTNCSSTEFSVDTYSNYVLDLKINDSAGNSNISSSSFSIEVDTGGSAPPSQGGGGGGGGGGGSSSFLPLIYTIEFGEIESFKIGRGKSEAVLLEVTNKGTRFLNECKLLPQGESSEWISNKQSESIGPGQNINYVFSLNVPLNAIAKKYNLDIEIKCKEANKSVEFNFEVVVGNFDAVILSTQRNGNKLKVDYSIENLDINEREFLVNYILLNSENSEIVKGEANAKVEGNAKRNFILEFELPKDSIGDFDLVFDVSDGRNSNRYNKKVSLSSSGLTGLAISETNLNTITWVGLVILFMSGVYLTIKFLNKHHKKHEGNGRKFITLDLKS